MSDSDSSCCENSPVIKRAKKVRSTQRPCLSAKENLSEIQPKNFGVYTNHIKKCITALHSSIETSCVTNDNEKNFEISASSPLNLLEHLKEDVFEINDDLQKQKIAECDEFIMNDWNCSSCTYTNFSLNMKCEICGAERPLIWSKKSTDDRERSPTPPPTPEYKPRSRRRPRKACKEAIQTLSLLKAKSISLDQEDSYISDEELEITDDSTLKYIKTIPIRISAIPDVYRHKISYKDTFLNIFEDIAKKKNVEVDMVYFYLNDKLISPYDTPESINLDVTDIIECLFRQNGAEVADVISDRDNPNIIEVIFQANDPKLKYSYSLHKNEPLERIMKEYAEKVNILYDELVFHFDGEQISSSQSPNLLDMENSDCIDVQFE